MFKLTFMIRANITNLGEYLFGAISFELLTRVENQTYTYLFRFSDRPALIVTVQVYPDDLIFLIQPNTSDTLSRLLTPTWLEPIN